MKICSQGTPFLEKYFAVPSVAIISNPILIKSLAAYNASLLSALLTEIKAVPFLGTVYPSDCIAFKNATPTLSLIPITSPVDFISGPKKTFSSLNFLNGSTAFLTAICLCLIFFNPKSFNFFPTDNCAAILANGILPYLLTKGTVLLDRGFTSNT